MQTFIQFLSERISPLVYHYTSIGNAFSICKDNAFHLSSSLGTSSEENLKSKGKPYYLSTTRHKLGGYNLEPYKEGVMFNLDGIKLGQKYSGKAVDYWGPEMRAMNQNKDEAEDRIFSKEPSIPNAKSYIKEVHILFAKHDMGHANRGRQMRRLLICLKTKDIPHWVYDDTRAWLLQDKRKSIKVDQEDLKGKDKEQFYRSNAMSYAKKELSPWIELYLKPNESNLSKNAKDMLYNLRYYDYRGEIATQLQNAIHNYRKSARNEVEKLHKVMRQSRATNVAEFINLIKHKFGIE